MDHAFVEPKELDGCIGRLQRVSTRATEDASGSFDTRRKAELNFYMIGCL